MLSEALLPEYDHEMAVTRALLTVLPDDALDWKPHEKSFSLGDLAAHVVNIPTWVGVTIDQDVLDMSGVSPSPPRGRRADLLALFDANVAEARKKLAGASDDTLRGTWALQSGDVEHFRMPRIAVLRGFVLNHIIHHRGQLTVYLRLRNVPLPSVYGPTADEAAF